MFGLIIAMIMGFFCTILIHGTIIANAKGIPIAINPGIMTQNETLIRNILSFY